ncbi:hypothetical protein GGI12_001595 [Dipsacomyces acuminosporus]|nr:hypothetical protein GGI12_001595 [Dipsacomyces acuminosporus]
MREPTTGRYDLLVNDYYLHHIYKSTISALDPHYVVTMGDIFSSQWIDMEEYRKRFDRFRWISRQVDGQNRSTEGRHIYLTLAGNHDIGYGEETEPYHIERYESSFGMLNKEWVVDIGGDRGTSVPPHRAAIINAMNLDKTRSVQFRRQTWEFVHKLAALRRQEPDTPLILFLHIPLDKPSGVCVDSPDIRYLDGYIDYQDYLTPATSAYLLHCLSPAFIFNGHDHNGCVSAFKVDSSIKTPIQLSGTDKTIQGITDFCSLSFEDLDANESALEEFIHSSISTLSSADMSSTINASWTTTEITVRSAMGAYGGASGIFDIRHRPHKHTESARVSDRDVVVYANGFEYQYSELLFGDHLIIRVLLIVDVVSFFVLSAVFVLLK